MNIILLSGIFLAILNAAQSQQSADGEIRLYYVDNGVQKQKTNPFISALLGIAGNLEDAPRMDVTRQSEPTRRWEKKERGREQGRRRDMKKIEAAKQIARIVPSRIVTSSRNHFLWSHRQTALTELYISGTSVNNLNGIENLTQLKTLFVGNLKMRNGAFFLPLNQSLEYLDVSFFRSKERFRLLYN
ncbi:hypothetical protein CAEBREN_05824 [Caenorhabditis brenneri]|uniref:Uncharacterized protein n=1 Tax=Caenorhabditis brenneri TaxID=135651 RepID=G0PI01_CAEBE|nr:hypothetical protein CAEBREN_05824 [Caenorhabditis brenneri]